MVLMNDEEKKQLLDRYVDIEWPDDVTDLRCVRCQRVPISHYISNCQHLFCNNCRRVFSDGGQWKCPQCHEYVTKMDDQDFDVEIKIHQLSIFCPNKKYGCQYENQLRKIPSHLKKCVDTRESALPMEYTGENRIEAVVSQLIKVNAIVGELKEGMKEMKDKVEEKFSQMERKSDEIDTKFNALMERVDSVERKSQERIVETHLAIKENTKEFQSMKSLFELMSHRIQQNESLTQQWMKQTSLNMEQMRTKLVSMTQELEQHHDKVKQQDIKIDGVSTEFNGLKNAQHTLTETMATMEKTAEERNEDTNLAFNNNVKEFKSIESMLESINQRIQQNESLLQQMTANVEEKMKMASMIQQLAYKNTGELNPSRAETYEWTVKDVTNNILNYKAYESEVFKFIGCEYDIKAFIGRKQNHLYIYFQFGKGNKINNFLNKNGFTTIKCIVRDQCNVENNKDLIRENHLKFNDTISCPNRILECELPDLILSPPYMANNCINITMLFEPPSIDRSFFSNNGILTWTVDNYETRKQDWLYNDIWSPSFYTSPQGYRVKTRLVINSEGPVIVEIYFLSGEHDDSLAINFPHKTTIVLYNQTDPSKNLVKSDQSSQASFHTIRLESSTLIEENGFIKDDSLLLKVVIESETRPIAKDNTPTFNVQRSGQKMSFALTDHFFP